MENWLILIADILVSVAIFFIAYKSEHPWSWLAFIPIANLWLMCDMADVPAWYILLFGIPIVGFGVYVYVWSRIAENTNKPPVLAILMLIPFVNVGAAWYMAFYEPGKLVT